MMKSHDSISKAALTLMLTSVGLFVLAGCSPHNLLASSVVDGPSATAGQTADQTADQDGIAVIIEGRVITLGEVHEYMKNQFLEEFLRQPEDQQFELNELAARQLVQNHIVQSEAQKQGKTSQAILDEIENAVPEPTIEEVADWYSKNQQRLRGAKLEDVADAIKDLLRKERRAKALNDFIDPKLDKLSWQMVLSPPRKQLEATRLARGAADAAVTITTFSDYQCPYCVRTEPILTEVLDRYPDQVRLVHRHFPLDSIHPYARAAAEASMCADEQGKFWEYHEGIFARSGKLKDGSFMEIGSAVGLDADEFRRCTEERRYKDFVEADFEAGQEAGVTGTPSIFLNGISLKGARSVDELSRYVDLELARIQGE